LETFATTCRTESWRTLLILCINKGFKVVQYDVKNAFVHADINVELYITLPTGLFTNNKYKNKVGKLNKALYGLKQRPRL
jgi:hypothetical protein